VVLIVYVLVRTCFDKKDRAVRKEQQHEPTSRVEGKEEGGRDGSIHIGNPDNAKTRRAGFYRHLEQ